MATPKRVTPKKVTTKPAKPAFDPKADLRRRMSASEKFARRDAGVWYPESGPLAGKGPIKNKVARGEYIDLYSDVTKTYNAVRALSPDDRANSDFNMYDAKRNTVKGRQYLNPNTIGGGPVDSSTSYKGGRQVRSGTIAGPRTARNLADLAKAKEMNAKRDALNMMKRRGKGR